MKTILVLATIVLSTSQAFAESRTALIYDIGKTEGPPRFVQETEITDTPSGERVWKSKIKNAAGETVMTEMATMRGEKLTSQSVEQLQIGEAYELNLDNQSATFRTFKITNGSRGTAIETETREVGENFITGPITESYLQARWPVLMSGTPVRVDFGIFEISKAIGFKFTKVDETATTVTVEMRPSNFFISMLVDTIRIEFDKERKRMVHFKGRTPLREQVQGRWKPLDAEIIYP